MNEFTEAVNELIVPEKLYMLELNVPRLVICVFALAVNAARDPNCVALLALVVV